MSPGTRLALALVALGAGITLAVLLALWLADAPVPRPPVTLREVNDVIAEAIHIARDAAR